MMNYVWRIVPEIINVCFFSYVIALRNKIQAGVQIWWHNAGTWCSLLAFLTRWPQLFYRGNMLMMLGLRHNKVLDAVQCQWGMFRSILIYEITIEAKVSLRQESQRLGSVPGFPDVMLILWWHEHGQVQSLLGKFSAVFIPSIACK